jgi:hypothetical protein
MKKWSQSRDVPEARCIYITVRYLYLMIKDVRFGLFVQHFFNRYTLPPNYILPLMPLVSEKTVHQTAYYPQCHR